MASEILMPRLGWTMEEGTFGEWLKQDGETVKAGDLLFTVESDKATQEVEAFDQGILRIPPDGPQPGAIIVVGGLLAYIIQPGEAAPFEQMQQPAQVAIAATGQPQVASPAQPTSGNGQSKIQNRSTEDFGGLRQDFDELSRIAQATELVEVFGELSRAVRAAHERPKSKIEHVIGIALTAGWL